MDKLRRLSAAFLIAAMMATGLGTATLEAAKPRDGEGEAAICAYLEKLIAYPRISPYILKYVLVLYQRYGCEP